MVVRIGTLQQETMPMSLETSDSTLRHHLTRIVATIGPASKSVESIRSLLEAGTNVFRLNCSHGTHEEHTESINRIRSLRDAEGRSPAILLDIPGPKLRIGPISDDHVQVAEDQQFMLSVGDGTPGDVSGVGFESTGWHMSIKPGERVLLGDGDMELEVTEVSDTSIVTTVKTEGEIRSRQGLNFPDTDLELAAVTDEDWDHIAFGLEHQVDAVALSFVQGPEDLIAVRRFMQRKGDSGPLLIAKIETPKAVENFHDILQRCDGVMVARGDLGISMPIEQVPVIQKRIIQMSREQHRFVITATQMLESMTHATRPTRAEATDVANAVYDGTDAVMLSGETAIGKHPALVVKTMRNILLATEPSVDLTSLKQVRSTVDDAVTLAVKELAGQLEIKAVLAPISSGSTALRLSRQRMGVPIIVGTLNEFTAHRLVFYQGVFPFCVDTDLGMKETIEVLIENARSAGFAEDGDRVLISGGLPVEKAGRTNFIRAMTIGDEI
jgi:pyruvate kinase